MMAKFFSVLGIMLALGISCLADDELPSWDQYEASFPIYNRIARHVLKQQGLQLMTTGGPMLLDADQPLHWAFWATDSRKMTLEEGKKLAASITQEIVALTRQNPAFALAMKNFAENTPKKSRPELGVVPSQFGFRIAFWDKKFDRPAFPYLAQIRATSDHFYFYYADPKTQALQNPIVFPLSELLEAKQVVIGPEQLQRYQDTVMHVSQHCQFIRSRS